MRVNLSEHTSGPRGRNRREANWCYPAMCSGFLFTAGVACGTVFPAWSSCILDVTGCTMLCGATHTSDTHVRAVVLSNPFTQSLLSCHCVLRHPSALSPWARSAPRWNTWGCTPLQRVVGSVLWKGHGDTPPASLRVSHGAKCNTQHVSLLVHRCQRMSMSVASPHPDFYFNLLVATHCSFSERECPLAAERSFESKGESVNRCPFYCTTILQCVTDNDV